jgi:hypothetical protein
LLEWLAVTLLPHFKFATPFLAPLPRQIDKKIKSAVQPLVERMVIWVDVRILKAAIGKLVEPGTSKNGVGYQIGNTGYVANEVTEFIRLKRADNWMPSLDVA